MYQSEPELMEESLSPPSAPHELSPAAFINAIQYANVLEGRFKQLQGRRCEGGEDGWRHGGGSKLAVRYALPLPRLPGQPRAVGDGSSNPQGAARN